MDRRRHPWGPPSDELLVGRIEGVKFVFLPRHGRGHRIPPGEVNARANVDALKRAGCTDLLAISAVGSLREALEPGRFVAVDQFVDRTFARASSFFGTGLMVMSRSPTRSACACRRSPPTPPRRRARQTRGATYLAMEGPQFSTRREPSLRPMGLRRDRHDREPEYKLAREAELPYALIGMVTDYDCWRESDAPVEVAEVIAQLQANAGAARRLVVELARRLPPERALADRHQPRRRLDHRRAGARSGADGTARRGLRTGAASAVEPRQPLGRHAEPIERQAGEIADRTADPAVAPPARAAGEGVLAEQCEPAAGRCGQSRHPP